MQSSKAQVAGVDRDAFMKQTQARWMEARTKFIQERGSLGWKERNEVGSEFWEMIDRNLDNAIAEKGLDEPTPKRT